MEIEQKENIKEELNNNDDDNNKDNNKDDVNKNGYDDNDEDHPVFHFQAEKAGMGTINKEEIDKIVNKAMKGSPYYKRQEEKRRKNELEVQSLKIKLQQSLNNSDIDIKKMEFNNFITSIQNELSFERYWIHVDLDMYYVACELRDEPSLVEKPVAVGSSIISTSNYIARKFGVRSAMPTFIAKKLCPELVVLPINMKKYKESSLKFMEVLKEYDPNLESLGSDEGRLDITDYMMNNNIKTEEEISTLMNTIRKQVFEKIGVTASAGCSINKMLAKLSSEKNKPNNQFFMPRSKKFIDKFIEDLPVRKIPGVGPKVEFILKGFGINNGKELKENLFYLFLVLRDTTFEFLAKRAYGISDNFHSEAQDRKSISFSKTFKPTFKTEELLKKIKNLAKEVSLKAIKEGFKGRTLSLTVKTSDFLIKQKSKKLDTYINSFEEIFKNSKILFKQCKIEENIRLLGIKLDSLMKKEDLEANLFKFFKKTEQKNSIEKTNKKNNMIKLNIDQNENVNQNNSNKNIGYQEENFYKKTMDLVEEEKKKIQDIQDDKNVLENFNDINKNSKRNLDVISLDTSSITSKNKNVGINSNSINTINTKEKIEIDKILEEIDPIMFAPNKNDEKKIKGNILSNLENSIFERKNEFISEKVICPSCCKDIETYGNYLAFNRHLDKCLLQFDDNNNSESQIINFNENSINSSINKGKRRRPYRKQKSPGRKKIKRDNDSSKKSIIEEGSLDKWFKKI